MFEKVNPMHPDKVADRIAWAIVDLAYSKQENPKVAVEVLIGHGKATVIIESTVEFNRVEIEEIVRRVSKADIETQLIGVRQDPILNNNQKDWFRCGDNGIFRGVPMTDEEKKLSEIARHIYEEYPTDGKYIINKDRLIICQSQSNEELEKEYEWHIINPLWNRTGWLDVDSWATNRKLWSDMWNSVTGWWLHGKDLSKADVSVNIYAFRKAQETGNTINLFCAIGDDNVDWIPYSEIVEQAREYINSLGGFEKFAERWLI